MLLHKSLIHLPFGQFGKSGVPTYQVDAFNLLGPSLKEAAGAHYDRAIEKLQKKNFETEPVIITHILDFIGDKLTDYFALLNQNENIIPNHLRTTVQWGMMNLYVAVILGHTLKKIAYRKSRSLKRQYQNSPIVTNNPNIQFGSSFSSMPTSSSYASHAPIRNLFPQSVTPYQQGQPTSGTHPHHSYSRPFPSPPKIRHSVVESDERMGNALASSTNWDNPAGQAQATPNVIGGSASSASAAPPQPKSGGTLSSADQFSSSAASIASDHVFADAYSVDDDPGSGFNLAGEAVPSSGTVSRERPVRSRSKSIDGRPDWVRGGGSTGWSEQEEAQYFAKHQDFLMNVFNAPGPPQQYFFPENYGGYPRRGSRPSFRRPGRPNRPVQRGRSGYQNVRPRMSDQQITHQLNQYEGQIQNQNKMDQTPPT
jgi:hypothetical protein